MLPFLMAILFSNAGWAAGGSCEYRVEYQIQQGHEEQVLQKFADCAESHPCENLQGHNKRLVREGDTLRITQKAQHAAECTKAAANKCFLEKNVLGKRVAVTFNGQTLSTNVCQDVAKKSTKAAPAYTQVKTNPKVGGTPGPSNRKPASFKR